MATIIYHGDADGHDTLVTEAFLSRCRAQGRVIDASLRRDAMTSRHFSTNITPTSDEQLTTYLPHGRQTRHLYFYSAAAARARARVDHAHVGILSARRSPAKRRRIIFQRHRAAITPKSPSTHEAIAA